MTPHEQIVAWFPRLRVIPYKLTSPAVREYNCIAWAAGDTQNFWWPQFGHWPDGVPRELTVDAFVQAYQVIGYAKCGDGLLEPGYEKIALYVDEAGHPTHAARQLPSGAWTSKLGKWWDIEHTLPGLEGATSLLGGNAYGTVKQFLRRPVP